MGLAAIAQAAAKIGFAAAGDTKQAVTVKTGPTPTHNTATDLSSIVWTHSTAVQGFMYDTAEKETSQASSRPGAQGAKSQAKTLLLQAVDLPTPPTEESIIVDAAGDEWTVASIETDPAGATHNLTLRR